MIIFLIKLFNFVIGCNCFDSINAVVHFFAELQPTFVVTDKYFFMSANAPIIISDDGSDDETPFVTPTESPDVHQR